MRRLILVAVMLIWMGTSRPAWAQECTDYDSVAEALSSAESCSAAAAKWRQCQEGVTADVPLSSIVIDRCEKTFLAKLSLKARKRYAEEMQLCGYRYARQEGTLFPTRAAGCQLDVAARFASNPAAAGGPAPRASFDCDQAQTVLEKAICSDIRLGHADLVLSRVYKEAKRNHPQEESDLVESEEEWRQDLATRCHLSATPLSQKTLNCLRNEFEFRFTDFDSCTDDDPPGQCLLPADDEDNSALADDVDLSPRASFDCEQARTALQTVICSDAKLGQADVKLARAYRHAARVMA